MARIKVQSYTFDDPRFDVLAGALRRLCDRWHALGCCLRVWHLCANRRTETIRPVELAQCLGLRRPLEVKTQERAVEAFVDIAGLGERCDGVVRVHLGRFLAEEER